MDAIKIYEDYFSKKQNVIMQMIQYYKQEGKTIALWGAGKKGIGFLKVIDPDNKIISCIFDKDINKIGVVLETGHIIKDFHKQKIDVIFVANSTFELEVVHILKKISPETAIVNIDNIILGDLEIDDILNEKAVSLHKKRNNKICAVVVLYNPSENVINNINSYVQELDKLYIYDNSTEKNPIIIENLRKIHNVNIIEKCGNFGLSIAFNETSIMAREQGYTWMITFDQDSIATEGMVEAMRKYVDSDLCDNNVAIVAPVVNDIDNSKEVQRNYCTYCEKVIQSGAMHNLNIMHEIGGYDENIFIDEVDSEYCIRCILNGKKIVKLNNALLMHNQQDEKVIKKFIEGTIVYIDKFSSDRYYYKYRNALYCYDKYKDIYPLYALDCENSIRKMKLQLKYDNNEKIHNEAVRQAIEDYKNGKYGKRYSKKIKKESTGC